MTKEDFYLYFYTLYIFAILFAILIAMKVYLKNENTPNQLNMVLVSIFLVCFIVLIGNRPENVGADTLQMMIIYDNYDKVDKRDPFMIFLMGRLHNLTDSRGYLYFLTIVFFSNVFLYIKNRDSALNKYLFFFFFLSMSYFLPLSINVARQGISLLFFLNAINYYDKKKWFLMSIFLFFSLCFHTTAIVAIILFIGSVILNKKKSLVIPFILFFLAAGLSIAKVDLIKLLPTNVGIDALDARTTGYFSEPKIDYQIGFRPTFFVYNLFFAIIGFYIMRYFEKRNLFEEYKKIKLYLIYFLLSSAVFFTAFAIPYSDRWGLFSWIFIPFFFEPFFKKGGKVFAVVSVLFSVTLFLIFQFVLS